MTSLADPPAPIRVVLADDSTTIRSLLRLQLDGHTEVSVVGEAADGAEAIAVVDAVQPDVVLLDVAMPVMDGLEALKEIRQRHGDSMAVVVWSGFSTREIADKAVELGANCFVEKSGDVEPILAALREAVDGSAPLPAGGPAGAAEEAPPETGPAAPSSWSDGLNVTTAVRRIPEAWVLVVALVAGLFAAVAGWSQTSSTGDANLTVLYVVPIAVMAVRFGMVGGLGGFAVASCLWLIYALSRSQGIGVILANISAYLVVGALIGHTSDRTRRLLADRSRDSRALASANRRLADAAAAAESARAELESSNADLRQFVHVASHDLAEPLRTIAGFSELVASRYGEQVDDSGRRFLGLIVEGAKRMQNLIDDLRSYTRTSQRDFRHDRIDMSEVVDEVRAALAATLEERSAQVVVVGSLPGVLGDRAMIGLVIQNLVSNGVKFNEAATPTVTISGATAAATDGPGRVTVIDVSDNGIGIDAEHRERIFELFRRLHTRDQYPGTGLGLAICRRIVERHRGTISVVDGPSPGTTFRIVLPSAAEEA